MLHIADNFVVDKNSRMLPIRNFETTPELLKTFMDAEGWHSYIQNKKAAKILSRSLGTHIKVNKTPFDLDKINPDEDSLVLFKVDKIEDTLLVRFFVVQFAKF